MTILTYLFQSSICLGIFYVFYKWLFSKETFYTLNRAILWSMLILSFTLPLIPWGSFFTISGMVQSSLFNEVVYSIRLDELIISAEQTTSINWLDWLVGVYLLGLTFILLRLGVGWLGLSKFIKQGKKRVQTDGTKLITHTESTQGPFSWMSYIVLSEDDLANCGEEILMHEKAHIHYMHSWDMLILNLILMVQWFNPAAWLFKRELEIVHEYQADAFVLKHGINAQKYQLLLIKKSVGDYMFNLANSFNHSHLTKRINMMLQKESSKWAKLKLISLLPLGFLLILGIGINSSCTEASALRDSSDVQADTKELPQVTPSSQKGEVFVVVEVMPEYPGGLENLITFLGENIQYPADAQKNSIQGRVIVEFIVNTDGSVTEPRIVRGVDSALDKEALRVISLMPKWKPGMQGGEKVRVKFTVPVSFRLKDKEKVPAK